MKQVLKFIVLSFIVISCSNNEMENSNNLIEKNFVDKTKVEEIATNILHPINNSNQGARNTILSRKKNKSTNEVLNKNGKASFYVVNYKEGGFLILSADNRTQPVLGFSDSNSFQLNEEEMPEGVEYWLDDATKQIADIQNSNIKQSFGESEAWKPSQIQNIVYRIVDDEEEECPRTEVYTNGPLLSTTWDQLYGFNDELPYITCSGSSFQVYAGCVPIALAQIMKFNEHPTSYNWSSMPDNYATTTTANFIEDIHDAIGNLHSGQPNYYCWGTTVSGSANIATILKTEFNYTTASWSNYNHHTVENNIIYGKPVILSGTNGSSLGHMWVCDGYKRTKIYFEDCLGVEFLHFYMNWGWNGAFNGWFAFDNFNPDNKNYNSDNKMTYNITP